MTFLSGSNEGGQKFQFATENYKCRPLLWRRISITLCKQNVQDSFLAETMKIVLQSIYYFYEEMDWFNTA